MPNSRITYLVTFDCHHTRVFGEPAPALRDVIWCVRCNRDTRVKSAPAEYRIRCQDCGYVRRLGTGKTNAELAAIGHRKSKPGHIVDMYNGHKLTYTFGSRDLTVTPMLPDSDPEPAF